MRFYINVCIIKKIILYGSVVIGLGICMVLFIFIFRFISIEVEGSNIENIWIWLGFYVGEGVFNFNFLMWYVEKSIGGDLIFIFLKDLFGLMKGFGVEDNWVIVSKLGIFGNIFYMYIGFIFEDFNKIGILIFFLVFFIIIIKLIKIKNGLIIFF